MTNDRDRELGSFYLTYMLDSAIARSADGLREVSEHKELIGVSAVNMVMLRICGQVGCLGCDRKWRCYVPMEELFAWERENPVAFRAPGAYADFLIRRMAPAFATAVDAPCWNEVMLGEAAQYITEALVAAGPEGISLVHMIERCGRGKIVPAERALFLLSYMRLLPKGPEVPAVVRLPLDHPLCWWEDPAPNPLDGTHLGADALAALRASSWWPV